MAVPLEVLQQDDNTEDKTVSDTDSRRNNDPTAPPECVKHEASTSFLPAITQQSEYVRLAKAGGHKGSKCFSQSTVGWACRYILQIF